MRTRGAMSWVRNTPTGLPDCTRSVSSFPEPLECPNDGVQRPQIAGRLAPAAVDDQLLRVLGDLRVEVVEETAQRGLLEPAVGVEPRPAGGMEREGEVEHDGPSLSATACGHPSVQRPLLAKQTVETTGGDASADQTHHQQVGDMAGHGPVEDAQREGAEHLVPLIER